MQQRTQTQQIYPIVMISLLMLAASAARGQEWSQWRGAARDGISVGAEWPDSLGADALRRAWQVDGLGPSYSGPVIENGIVYTTENADTRSESLIALDAATGSRLFVRSWPVGFVMAEFMKEHGNWPKSTPSVDGEDLLFLGIAEHLHSLDAKTGESRWSIDFPERFGTPVPEFGCSSSPLISGDAVYVQAAGSIFGIDRRTGEIRWRASNLYATESDGDDLEAYGSPILTTIGGTEQVVANTVKGLVGIHARSGEVLWRIEADKGGGDAPNVTPALWQDSGSDFVLTSTENSGTPLFRIAKIGQGFEAEEVWRSKVHGNMASPVVAGDHAYLPLANGRLAFLDLEKGREAWISKPLFGPYASVALRGDKILLLTTDGELHLLAGDRERINVLDTRRVAERTWAHLAAQENRIYVRSHDSLIAFEWSTPPRQRAESGDDPARVSVTHAPRQR